MITGFDTNETHDLVMDNEKDAKDPTVYTVGGLTVRVKQRSILCYEGDPTEGMFQIVRSCLKKIKNYRIGKQEPKDFDVITDELVDSLPLEVFQFLSREIVRVSSLSEQEQKN